MPGASQLLAGKRGLIVGVANDHSIATGCAEVLSEAGARLALTYLSEKAKPYVAPVAEAVGAEMLLPLDVTRDAELEAVFERIDAEWGGLDFLVHSIAFVPMQDLHGRVTDCSREGFAQAMDISVHSFARMARLAEPLMTEGSSLLTVSYYGAEKVVEHYNLMGPVKAALESLTRYMAAELGPQGIRVNAVSPGPLMTRAASGIDHFEALARHAEERAPLGRLATIREVGEAALCLVSQQSSAMTGNVMYVDAGYHVMS